MTRLTPVTTLPPMQLDLQGRACADLAAYDPVAVGILLNLRTR